MKQLNYMALALLMTFLINALMVWTAAAEDIQRGDLKTAVIESQIELKHSETAFHMELNKPVQVVETQVASNK